MQKIQCARLCAVVAVVASSSVASADIVIDPFTSSWSSAAPSTAGSDSVRRFQQALTGAAFENRGFEVSSSRWISTAPRYAYAQVSGGSVTMGATARLSGSQAADPQYASAYFFNSGCQFDNSGINLDGGTYSSLAGVTAFQFNVSSLVAAVADTVKVYFEIGTSDGVVSNGDFANLSSTGLQTFNLADLSVNGSDPAMPGTAVDWTKVSYVSLQFSFKASNLASSVTFDSFTAVGAAVPAPGALALLGVVGVAGGRRRR